MIEGRLPIANIARRPGAFVTSKVTSMSTVSSLLLEEENSIQFQVHESRENKISLSAITVGYTFRRFEQGPVLVQHFRHQQLVAAQLSTIVTMQSVRKQRSTAG